jgi:hypothetical protein
LHDGRTDGRTGSRADITTTVTLVGAEDIASCSSDRDKSQAFQPVSTLFAEELTG